MFKWWKQKKCKHDYHVVVDYTNKKLSCYGGTVIVERTVLYCPCCDLELDMEGNEAEILLEKQKNIKKAKESIKND